ncbi:N-acetyltransferase [Synechococcus sp. PCC 7336]|uniref:GNAT family N-acetyltransferase n=1 Tax=Synechococcus sp. PCC 7336 TaxID=195250 RepID=UPI00034D58CA|nr:GNAT family N-acetyltransferase [Synechococcus sp. PCC 7336]
MPHQKATRNPNRLERPSPLTQSIFQRTATHREPERSTASVPPPTSRTRMDLTQIPLQSQVPLQSPQTTPVRAQQDTGPRQYSIASPKPSDNGYQEIAAISSDTKQQVGRVKIKGSAETQKMEIASLRVDPGHRQQGVSKSLISAATSAGQQQGYRKAKLGVDPEAPGMGRSTLEGIYGRQGFKKNGAVERGNPLMERRL